MSVEKAKELCRKYAKATEYWDEFIEHRFVKMRPTTRKLVNQIAQEILDELEATPTLSDLKKAYERLEPTDIPIENLKFGGTTLKQPSPLETVDSSASDGVVFGKDSTDTLGTEAESLQHKSGSDTMSVKALPMMPDPEFIEDILNSTVIGITAKGLVQGMAGPKRDKDLKFGNNNGKQETPTDSPTPSNPT